MYDEKNNNQEFSNNGNPDEHKAEEITTNFVMKDSTQEESSTQENQGQQMTGGESHAGQSQTVTGEVSQTAVSYGQSGYSQSQGQSQGGQGSQYGSQSSQNSQYGSQSQSQNSQSSQTLGGQTQSGQSMYGQNSQNGQQNQNTQGQGLNQYHPGQQSYGQYGQNRYSQSQYGENRTSGSYQNSYIPPEPAKKEKKKHGMASKIAGITAAALLFGTVSGGTMVGINMISDSFRKTEYPQVSQSETLAENNQNQAGDSTEASGNAQASVALATDVSSIVEKAMPSVVAINNTMLYQGSTWFGQTQTYEVPSSGSGIIVGQNDEELLIVTNNHVVADSSTLSVTFIDDTAVNAAIKGTDAESDLAVIAVPLKDIPEGTLSQITIATLGDSDDLKVGQGVIAIGNALGYGQSVTVGYVSALNREVRTENDVTRNLLQTDAAINPGNSGGALLNMKGEVIGINAAKYSSTEVEGMGYAIPISKAQDIINNLMTKKTRNEVAADKAGYLGIQGQNIDEEMAKMFDMPTGIFVYKIIEGGAASKTDLREKDIIVKFDDQTVKTMANLQDMLKYYEEGETVDLTVKSLENGTYVERTVTVTLGSKASIQTNE